MMKDDDRELFVERKQYLIEQEKVWTDRLNELKRHKHYDKLIRLQAEIDALEIDPYKVKEATVKLKRIEQGLIKVNRVLKG